MSQARTFLEWLFGTKPLDLLLLLWTLPEKDSFEGNPGTSNAFLWQ